MALVGTPLAIGTAATTLLTCPATQEASLHSLLVNNPTGGIYHLHYLFSIPLQAQSKRY